VGWVVGCGHSARFLDAKNNEWALIQSSSSNRMRSRMLRRPEMVEAAYRKDGQVGNDSRDPARIGVISPLLANVF